MTIREMTKEDCEAVWELQKTCFTVPWSLDSIRAMFGTPGYLSLIAMEDGILTGYAGIKQVLDEADITNVAVHPDRRRQGTGRQLLRSFYTRPSGRACAGSFWKSGTPTRRRRDCMRRRVFRWWTEENTIMKSRWRMPASCSGMPETALQHAI